MSVKLSAAAKAWVIADMARDTPSSLRCDATAFADCVKEFRQYGYDPYNSADDGVTWYRALTAKASACKPHASLLG